MAGESPQLYLEARNGKKFGNRGERTGPSSI
jgi:hypothetical protein